MTILMGILFSVEAICSVLLITIILMQKAKGGGLGVAFGAGMSENLFGSRTGNVLTKGTVIIAIVFMINTVVLAILFARSHDATLMDAHMPPPRPPAQQQQQRPVQEQLPAVPRPETDARSAAPAPDLSTFESQAPAVEASPPVDFEPLDD